MYKKLTIFTIIIGLLLITTSCSIFKQFSYDKKKPYQKPKSTAAEKKDNTKSNIIENRTSKKSIESSQNTEHMNENTSKVTNKLNPTGLDNTLYGWGMRVMPDHKTPEITSKQMNMIKKYDAIFTGDTSKKIVYLTFDEGYENGYTTKILDILKANNVNAAFFVTGPYIKGQIDLVKRMVDEGHIVGNHTVNHPSLPSISDDKIKDEIDNLNAMFKNLTGKNMHYFRPPKGEYSERTLYITKSLGYKTVFWSLAMADWQPLPGGPEESYNTVIKRLHPGAVILLHAVSKDDTLALDRIIKDIKAQGYVFKTLDDIK